MLAAPSPSISSPNGLPSMFSTPLNVSNCAPPVLVVVEEVDVDAERALRVADGVDPGAADELIVAFAGLEEVVAAAALHRVVADPAVERVVALAGR